MSEWETFCDKSYYHLWRVRRKNERGFDDGYHIHNGEEARDLVEMLNRIERELDAERTLADRLAEAATKSSNVIGPPDKVEWSTDDELNDAWDCSQSALAAWKEARCE